MDVVQLPNQNASCQSAEAYPLSVSGACGALLRRKVLICGGQTEDGTAITKCYVLADKDEWKTEITLSMKKPRAFAGALIMPSENRLGWWITGGRDSHGTTQVTTELFDDFDFISGPNLPEPLSHHCLVHLPKQRSLVVGGQIGGGDNSEYENLYSDRTWIYDWGDYSWIEISARLREGRHSHACTAFDEGDMVVVAGGISKESDDEAIVTEVLHLSTGIWKSVRRLPWPSFGVSFIKLSIDRNLPLSILLKVGTTKESVLEFVAWNKESEDFDVKSMTTTTKEIRPYGVQLIVPEQVVCF